MADAYFVRYALGRVRVRIRARIGLRLGLDGFVLSSRHSRVEGVSAGIRQGPVFGRLMADGQVRIWLMHISHVSVVPLHVCAAFFEVPC